MKLAGIVLLLISCHLSGCSVVYTPNLDQVLNPSAVALLETSGVAMSSENLKQTDFLTASISNYNNPDSPISIQRWNDCNSVIVTIFFLLSGGIIPYPCDVGVRVCYNQFTCESTAYKIERLGLLVAPLTLLPNWERSSQVSSGQPDLGYNYAVITSLNRLANDVEHRRGLIRDEDL